jgi:Zn-finger nucleic acid-binding protein
MPNCRNCSAPLPPSGVVCAFCGTRNDIDLTGLGEYTVNAPQAVRTCPRCKAPLQTIDLKVQGTFLIERCEQCLGLFFDPGELEALLNASVANVFDINRKLIDGLNQSPRSAEYGVGYIPCPVCAKLMNRVSYGVRSGVIIDRCGAHGVWLDGGELRQLLEWAASGGQILTRERQEERKREEERTQQRLERERLVRAARDDGALSFGGGAAPYRGRHSDDDVLGLLVRAAGKLLG